MTETNLTKTILIAIASPFIRMFRNNVAQAWTGQSKMYNEKKQIWVEPGDVIIKNARPLHAGLCKGSSDLIGLQAVTITPDMVGQIFGRFTAFEIKKGRGKIYDEQISFINMVNKFGGRAGIVRTSDDAKELLK